jgi:hypothetical protein
METEKYKKKIMSNCSREQEKSVVLKACPHAFFNKFIDEIKKNRNWKCSLCGVKFWKDNIHNITFS